MRRKNGYRNKSTVTSLNNYIRFSLLKIIGSTIPVTVIINSDETITQKIFTKGFLFRKTKRYASNSLRSREAQG